jgi:hypothetical protein
MSSSDELQINSVTHTETFDSTILSTTVPVTVQVAVSYGATMEFTLLGRSYTFCVHKTGGRSTDCFIKSFHSYTKRNVPAFGEVGINATGGVVVNMSTTQKVAAVVQACKDIVICLDKIMSVYQGSVVDYALWYREKHPEFNDYSSLISLVTCHCIVHAGIMSPCIPCIVVKF